MNTVVQLPTRAETPIAVANEAAEIIGLAIRLRTKIYNHPAGSPLSDEAMDAAYEALNALIKAAEDAGDLI